MRLPPSSVLCLFALHALVGVCFSQEPFIAEIHRMESGEIVVDFQGREQFYYTLFRGETVDAINEPVHLGLGSAETLSLMDSAPLSGAGFYLVLEISTLTPADLDEDGIDDLLEWRNPDFLNPFNGLDASLDFDQDGRANWLELQQGTDPTSADAPEVFLSVKTSSPLPGESAVATTRESVFRLSQPLSPNTPVTEAHLHAQFGGELIASRIHTSQDRKTVTLFYPNGLPPSARVRVVFNGTGLRDIDGNASDFNGDGGEGGTLNVDFDTLGITTIDQTAVTGRVFASELGGAENGVSVNAPLPGVRVTVDGRENELFAVTDSMGNFRLEPAPAGRFFVHINGKTATADIPEGAYYPSVGKAWESVAGEEVNVGTIYLPLIPPDTLQPVSETEETSLTFNEDFLEANPKFRGVEVRVPAGSLFTDDGTTGGMAGIAPVAPDRLPGTLPAGLAIQDVVTIQTDGATNFDVPAPICVPNLPDPETGELLPPGAKSALWSFNHDTGQFEIVGPMTVSEDGRLICTDPGVGVQAPGWHGSLPGTAGRARPPRVPRRPSPTPDCPEATNTQLAESGYKIAKDITGCAADVLGVREALNCVKEIVTLIPDLIMTARDLSNFSKENETAAALSATALVMKFFKDRIVGFSSCFEAAGPNKVKAVASCLNAGLAIGEEYCILKNDPTKTPVECTSEFSDYVCEIIKPYKAFVSRFEKLVSRLENFEKQGKLLVACTAADAVEDIIKRALLRQQSIINGGVQLQSAAQDETLTEEETIALQEALEVIIQMSEELLVDLNFDDDPLVLLNTYQSLADDLASRSQTLLLDELQPVARRLHYVIDMDPAPIRAMTSSQGTVERNLRPNQAYFFAQYDPIENLYGEASGVTQDNGEVTFLTPILLAPVAGLPDTDGDGLVDPAEFVVGTLADNPDSDDDGLTDFAEVRQGSNPLDGRIARTGIIASAETPGTAMDVDALNEFVAIADGDAGVTVFNVFNGMDPVAVAQIDTPGSAIGLACDGRFIAVADGAAGLTLVDISDPPFASVHRRVQRGFARAVEASAGIAYVGHASGLLLAVEMNSGAVLTQMDFGIPVEDVRLDGDHLYVLSPGVLNVLDISSGLFDPVGSVNTPGSVNTGNGRMRLFVGGGLAYPVHRRGYNTIDVSDPANPVLIAEGLTDQFGWKQIALNGSGLAVAVRGTASSFGGEHHAALYDASDPQVTDAFLNEFPTPGVARSVSIFNGLAYIADHESGLQVVSYLPFDSQRQAPTIQLTTNASEGLVEEGKPVRLTSATADDVQVRNVEFYVDGVLAVSDGNFPFEHRFIAPLLTETDAIRVRARVYDTGGNSAWSEEIILSVTEDATPPQILSVSPRPGSRRSGLENVGVIFNETMDSDSMSGGAIQVASAGLDGLFDTGDDEVVSSGSPLFLNDGKQAVLPFPNSLPFGHYQIRVSQTVADRAGNSLNSEHTSNFEIAEITIVALRGTPADPFIASANAGQTIEIEGEALSTDDAWAFPVLDAAGGLGTRTVSPAEITSEGRIARVVVPSEATTGSVASPDGMEWSLQIVPTLSQIDGGAGRDSTLWGSGFAEGQTRVRFGDVLYEGEMDVRDWNGRNNRLDVPIPPDARLPYEIITPGGRSGRSDDVVNIVAAAETGTAAQSDFASANVGQQVALFGNRFDAETTRITMEAMEDTGVPYILTIEPDSVGENGGQLTFTVPEAGRTGILTVLGGGAGRLLQVVPRITQIDGGASRDSILWGSGFTEGQIQVRFGNVEVAEGFNVRNWNGRNNRLDIAIPADASLPYEIITEGGRSGRVDDVIGVVAQSETGTPALPGEASANVGQQVTLFGNGFTEGRTRVSLEAMDDDGVPFVVTIDPDQIAPDGSNLTFTVPNTARTGPTTVLSGGDGPLLQIVPRITQIEGGASRDSILWGSGFTESQMRVRFGGVEVTDGFNVQDWNGRNNRLDIAIPADASLPYEIITEGGRSGRVHDVIEVVAQAETGTPAQLDQASANVGQQVTLIGDGFTEGRTRVSLEAMDAAGVPFIVTIDPDQIAPDGTELNFTVPNTARTGFATILSGGDAPLLQIVPRITQIDGGAGRDSTIWGSGFTESRMSVRFGGVEVGDGFDVRDWNGRNNRLDIAIPIDAELPYEIITEGGRSGRDDAMTRIEGAAETGSPTDGDEASANAEQTITLTGNGFSESATAILIEATDTDGRSYIRTAAPDSVGNDGTTLTFTIPQEATTGFLTVMNGGAARWLQIVPTLSSITSTTPGASTTVWGSGFVEGATTLTFGTVEVVDGIEAENNRIEIRDFNGRNVRADLEFPANGAFPIVARTPGGTSNALNP